MKRILLLRMDKIGDLLCTLPIDQILKPKTYEVLWVVSPGLGQLANLAVPPRKSIELDKNNPKEGRLALQKILKDFNPDFAISIQCPWWVHYELWKHKVPIRGGVLSKWDSFLFLNRGLRQKRSLSFKHESDYNRELLEYTLDIPTWKPINELDYSTPYLNFQMQDFPERLLSFHLERKKYFVVHPGMAGSALNWPELNYINLIYQLVDLKYTVVITGTMADEKWMIEIKKTFQSHPQVCFLQSLLDLQELICLLAHAKAVIAPSTGVIHLAAALKTPVVGFYSPIIVQHPTRWAPRGSGLHLIFTPKINSSKMPTADDMKLITVNQVINSMNTKGLI